MIPAADLPLMASSIALLYAILGPDIGSPLSIKISPDDYVGELKKAIKKEKEPDLDHVAADKLGLYKVRAVPRAVLAVIVDV